jgi:hypothetical protein
VNIARHVRLIAGGGIFFALTFALPTPATAADLLGLYIGGAIGQAQVEAGNLPNPDPIPGAVPTLGRFSENHAAYEAIAGLRPIPIVGAEFAYVDFGRPAESLGYLPPGPQVGPRFPLSASVRMKGAAAFALLYLPVPVVDIYFKAGLARLQTSAITIFTVPPPYAACVTTGGARCQFSREYDLTNTGIAAGAGAQVKFGSLAVRGEYTRYSAAGENPQLFAIGLTWNF